MKAQQDGELRLEVGGKRKREAEVFSANKRVMLGQIMAIPEPRSAASPLIALPPTLAPTSISPNLPPSQPHPMPSPPLSAGQPLPVTLPVNSHRGLVEAIELYNDLPTLRAEIEWMRAQRELGASQKETQGKKSLISETIKRTATPDSNWSKYRQNI